LRNKIVYAELLFLQKLFIPGYFMCDKYCCKGEWSILQKFLLTKSMKSNNVTNDLENLRNIMKVHIDDVPNWDNITKSNQGIATLSQDLYQEILRTFSLPVRSRLI